MPTGFTADGALDGVSHMLEVLFDSMGKPYHDQDAGGGAKRASRLVVELPASGR